MWYFLLGIVFAYMGLPILETLTSAICLRLEEYKAKHSVQINRYNLTIEEENSTVTSLSNPIGFVYNTEEENEVSDDD